MLVMWWMYQSAQAERMRNDERMDQKDEAFRSLEREVRTEITTQLVAATSALKDNNKIMERVIDKLK